MRPTARQLWAGGLAIAFAVLPSFLGRNASWLLSETRADVLAGALVLAAMALSLNVLMGYAGQISLGHGALVGVGAYAAGLVAGRYYLPASLGLVVAAAAGGIVAFLVGLPALRLRGLYLAITTLAFTAVMEFCVFLLPWLSRGSGGVEIPRPYIGSFGFVRTSDYLAIVLVVLLGLWLVDANLTRTRLGRAFFAIREDEQVAQSFGVDVARYKLGAFVLSGAMAGIAGALYGHLRFIVNSETFTFGNYSLRLVILVVIGGLGSRAGVAAAAVVMTIFPELLRGVLSWETGKWDLIIGAGLLIYAVARHPGGFAEAIREARHQKASKAAKAAAAAGGLDDDDEPVLPKLPSFPRPDALAGRMTATVGGSVPVLEVNDVRVRFGGLVAVDGASLAVPHGKIVGLIGPNGAGKSTLFNAVSGFVAMQSGAVSFLGQRIEHLPPHARSALGMGRTFQHVGLARNLSIADNLLIAQHPVASYSPLSSLAYLPSAGKAEDELRRRAHDTIVALGFEELVDQPVKLLSGGQQRIVELACALITAPELLLLDEPSAGMAPAAVENLAERLAELRDDLGRTVLLIEHHLPLVLDVCDEIYVLAEGRVLAHGTPSEITSDPAVIDAYLGGPLPEVEPAPRRRRQLAAIR